MSYLLDALRKSELERRVGEVPTLSPDFAVPPTSKRRHRWIFLIVSLVVINLGTLLYITFLDRARPNKVSEQPLHPSPVQSATTSSEPAVLQPVHKPPAEMEQSTESLSGSDPVTSIKTPSVTTQPKPLLSAKTQSESQTTHGVPAAKAPPEVFGNRTTKAVEKRTPDAKTISRIKTQSPVRQKSTEKTVPVDRFQKTVPSKKVLETPLHHEKPKTANFEKPKLEEPAEAPQPPVTNTPSITKTEAIPLLDEMPRDFQREFPTLNINVFVYSKDPDERFVIIDMVKYVAGQNTDSGAEILELRQDSVVVKYRGRKFRIKRP